MASNQAPDTTVDAPSLISPSAFRELEAAAQERILAGVARFGVDHAMYALVDRSGDVVRIVRCCTPARPCGGDLFRIRRGMSRPVLGGRGRRGGRSGPRVERFELPSEPESVRLARRLVENTTRSWEYEPTNALDLVLSELVTNAVVHASLTAVAVTAYGDVLRVEVFDDSLAQPQLRAPDGLLGGYGLNLVNELSEGWGWSLEGEGKRVWADVATS